MQYIQAVEDAVYAQLPYFVKYASARERRDLITARLLRAGRILENDYETFEASFDPELIEMCEVELVRYMLREAANPLLLEEMVCDMKGEGAYMTTMVYKLFRMRVVGRRKSGDAHTSLGNGFTNLMVFLFVCWRAGLDETQYDILVEGDDSIAWLARGVHIRFDVVAAELGFTVKMVWARVANEGVFCQLCYEPKTGAIVRDALKVLVRLSWSRSHHVGFGRRKLMVLFKAKALSLAYESGACPILWALAVRAYRHTAGVVLDRKVLDLHLSYWEKMEFEHAQAWAHDSPYEKGPYHVGAKALGPPPLEVRAFYEMKYKVPISMQLLVERNILDGDGPLDLGPFFQFIPAAWQVMWQRCVIDWDGKSRQRSVHHPH